MPLADRSAWPIVPTRDLARAKTFYADTLGLPLVSDEMGVAVFRTGDTFMNVYETAEAGGNRANAVVWDCGDAFDAIVAELQGKGVTFEHYPDMGMTLDGDVHRADGFAAAWFKDPDGNILHINSMAAG